MAWKGRTEGDIDYKRLLSTLVQSKLQNEDSAVFQVIESLINGAQKFKDGLVNSIKKTDQIDLKTQVSGILPPANGGVYFLYYIPELVDGFNVASSVGFFSHYLVTDRLVYISGKINLLTVGGLGTFTTIELSLPIPSKFSSADQCHGIANGNPIQPGGTLGFAGIITGNAITGKAQIQFYAPSVDNFDIRFMLSYERVPI